MSARNSKIDAQLREAQTNKFIIRFSRPFESGAFIGFVLDSGPKFFLLAVLDDGFQFEQYTCLRIADVRHLEAPAKRESFYKAARKLRGDKLPAKIKVNLTSSATILRTLHPSVVTVHREKVSPDTCVIGRITNTTNVDFEILEIDPDAKWDCEPSYYRLNQITRIDLPGLYEKALLLVGGEPQFNPGTFQ
jgi:hypothetical protein